MKFLAVLALFVSMSTFAQLHSESYLIEKEVDGRVTKAYVHAVVTIDDKGCISSLLSKETSDSLAKITNESVNKFDYKCADGTKMKYKEFKQEKKRGLFRKLFNLKPRVKKVENFEIANKHAEKFIFKNGKGKNKNARKLTKCEKKFSRHLKKAKKYKVADSKLSEFTKGLFDWDGNYKVKVFQIDVTKDILFSKGKCNKKLLKKLKKIVKTAKKSDPAKLKKKKVRCENKIDRQIAKAKKKGVSDLKIKELSTEYELTKIFNQKGKGKCYIRDMKKAVRAAIKAAK